MTIVRPDDIRATLTASNVLENEYPIWAAGTTYAVGDRVIVLSTHNVYENSVASNVGKDPTTSDTWLLVGVTNKYKMFDELYNTQTENTSSIQVTFETTGEYGAVNTAALLNILCESINITGTYDSVEVYNKTISTIDYSNVTDIYDYFFAPILTKKDITVTDLPNFIDATYTVTLSGGGTVKCGILLFGYGQPLGCTLYGISGGIIDYSKKEADEWGNITLVKRAYSKRVTADVVLRASNMPFLVDTLTELRATPTLFIGADASGCSAGSTSDNCGTSTDFSNFTVYGFYKDYTVGISNPVMADLQIEIEGLT